MSRLGWMIVGIAVAGGWAAGAEERPRIVVVGPPAQVAEQHRVLEKSYEVIDLPLDGAAVFPPVGDAYKDNPEAHRVWRGIHAAAPDVVIMRGEYRGLVEALRGKVPVLRGAPFDRPKRSPLRIEQEERLRRTPAELAAQLARVYGHELPTVVYIPAVALLGRLRLGALEDVETLAAPYINGQKDSLAGVTASHLSGHLLFAELARRTGKPAYRDRVLAAAALGFNPDGSMKEAMPYHSEMSDAVFMSCPILGEAGRLTGEERYFAMAIRHLRFMEKLDLRADGLYRHSPLDETAWGRGNAFPALGLAWLLETMPAPDPGVLASYRKLMDTLRRHQDAAGLWHQVIDRPETYAEFSATAMIAVAAQKGIRHGWLPAAVYEPVVAAAFKAILARTSADGVLLDVCESTGKQNSLEAYLHRKAIWDRDPRGGAMALLLATELAAAR